MCRSVQTASPSAPSAFASPTRPSSISWPASPVFDYAADGEDGTASPSPPPAGATSASTSTHPVDPSWDAACFERGHRSAELSGAGRGGAGVDEFQNHGVLLGLAESVERLRRLRARRQRGGEIGWNGSVALRLVGGGPPAVGLRGLDLGQAGPSHPRGGDQL